MAKKPKAKVQKRISKEINKEIEEMEDDALSASEAGGIVDTIEKNRTILIFASIGLFLLLCGVLVFKQLGTQRSSAAAQAFTSASNEKSIEKLDAVMADYPGSVPAGNALLSKAALQIDAGNLLDATKTLEMMRDNFPDHPLHANAYFLLGNLYQKSGEVDKAALNFQKVIDIQGKDGELSPISQIRLGDLELTKGNGEIARQNYEDAINKYGGNPFTPIAEMRTSQINLTMPQEIDPPAPAQPKPEEVKAEVEAEE